MARSVRTNSRRHSGSGASVSEFLARGPVVNRLLTGVVGPLALLGAVSLPSLVLAQYSETKIGEYLNYAVAATNGSVYAGYNSIGYSAPSIYTPAAGWTGLPCSLGFNTSYPYYGSANGISRDGTVLSGYTSGSVSNGVTAQYAAYWVNGVEQLVPAPPDDLTANIMSATAISGDGTTLLVQDSKATQVETYVFAIATQTFISIGYLGTTTKQTYGTALSYNGAIAIGYSNLDNAKTDGYVWTAAAGLKDIGIPHPATYYLEPTCMSDDGSVIYGRYTELNGWVGFRYTAAGFQDIGGLSPSACTADGTETVGIQDLYFPGVWTTTNGGGFVDDLLSAHGIKSALGDLGAPVTISPDGSLMSAIGVFAYVGDQVWYGTYQVGLPFPLNTAPVVAKEAKFSTAYETTLTVRAPGLVGYAGFNLKAVAAVVSRPQHAASFDLKPNGAFSYTPKAGFGGHNDYFSYHLIGPYGTSRTGRVRIGVNGP